MPERVFAVVGFFEDAQALLRAVPRVRRHGLGRVEGYTPYPVHGLATALELRRSPLGGMVLVMGILGALSAIVFEWWANAVDYPTVTGGKALFSWEAFVPIMFEVTVAFATFTAGFGMLVLLNRLPFFASPLVASPAMPAITRDRLALAIEETGASEALDPDAARAALLDAGATSVAVVPHAPPTPVLSSRGVWLRLGAIGLACVVSGQAMYWSVKLYPAIRPMVRMLDQPRVDAQTVVDFSPDHRANRLPAFGTVGRGDIPYDLTAAEAEALVNPLPRTAEVMAQGRRGYETYCVVCHGPLATGQPLLTKSYGAKPADLQSAKIRAYPDGHYYDVIMRGKNAMPSYAVDLSPDERWAVVHYVRALQRAQNATDEDLE